MNNNINAPISIEETIGTNASSGQDTPLRFKDAIFVKQNYRYNKVHFREIMYLKAEGNYTSIHTAKKTYMIKHTLQGIMTQYLTDDCFIRVHRSFALNADHITAFNDTTAVIAEQEIPVGPNYRSAFLKLFIG